MTPTPPPLTAEALPEPVRLTRSRRKGSKLVSPNGLPVVCVTRGTKWGNPFTSTSKLAASAELGVGSPEFAVHLFRLMLEGDAIVLARHPWAPARRDEMLRSMHEIRGKNLACWCKEGKACHADALLEMANGPATSTPNGGST